MTEPGGFWSADGRVARELQLRVLLLDAVPLFRLCTARELEELASCCHPVAFEPGDVLCVEGEVGDACFVVAAGEAMVTVADKVLAIVGPDDVVGERGSLLKVPRRATVSALSHVLAYAISGKQLQAMADSNPALGAAMRADVERRYGSVNQ
jgi:CRP-like cAMP-binding protein